MLQSIWKNRKGILLMLISSLFACVGQLFWKISAQQGIVFLLLGFCFYGIGACVMLIAYKFGDLSVLQPMLSLNYVISIVLAAVVLQEIITFAKIIGILIIMVGVLFVAGGDKK